MMLTQQQLAKKFNVGKLTIRRWWLKGLIPHPIRIGKTLRWRESDIEAFIDQQQTEPQPEAIVH